MLDPLLCGVLAASPAGIVGSSAAPSVPSGVEELLARLSRRAAWGADGARGTARLELGEGALAGAVVTVHAERREVRVEIELPPHAIDGGLSERLRERLTQKGFSVAELRVR